MFGVASRPWPPRPCAPPCARYDRRQEEVVERAPQWSAVRASRKAFERLVDDLLDRVEEAGAIRFSDRRVALSALLGMVNTTAQWYRPRGRLSPPEIADGYLQLLAVGARAPVS